jgi:hypothetical protein
MPGHLYEAARLEADQKAAIFFLDNVLLGVEFELARSGRGGGSKAQHKPGKLRVRMKHKILAHRRALITAILEAMLLAINPKTIA